MRSYQALIQTKDAQGNVKAWAIDTPHPANYAELLRLAGVTDGPVEVLKRRALKRHLAMFGTEADVIEFSWAGVRENDHGDEWYADGLGVWHAYVKDRHGGEIVVARRIIHDAMEADMQADPLDLAEYVRKNIVRAAEQDRPGFTHFREREA